MHIGISFHFDPIGELEWMIRALGIFKRHKIKYLSRRRRTRSTSTWPAYHPGG